MSNKVKKNKKIQQALKTQQEVSVDRARYTRRSVSVQEESWEFLGAWIAKKPCQVPHTDEPGAAMQTRRRTRAKTQAGEGSETQLRIKG